MKQPTYQQALSNAWEMVWHHKNLWVLGLLAAFLGQFGLGDFFSRIWMLYYKGSISSFSLSMSSFSMNFSNLSWYNVVGIVWLLILLLAIMTTVIFLSVTAQGALIAYSASWYKSRRFKNFAKAWHKSVSHFWQMLAVVVLYKVLFCVIIVATALLLKCSDFAANEWIHIAVGIVIGFLLFLYLVYSIVYIYSLGYIVIDNKKPIEAVNLGWQLFSKHVLVSIEVGLIMMLLNLVLVVIGVTVVLVALIPATLIWVTAGIFSIDSLAIFGFTVGMLVWLFLILMAAAAFNAFNVSAWTYLFIKMHKEGVVSRVVHHIGKIFRRS